MPNLKDTDFALPTSPVSRNTAPAISSTSTFSGSISSALSQNFMASSKLKLSKHSSTYNKLNKLYQIILYSTRANT